MLTRPPSVGEVQAYLATGYWEDRVAVDLAVLRAGGDRCAVVDRAGGATSYSDLAAQVERLAGALAVRGVTTGEPVVLVIDNDLASVVAVHAVWHLGAVAMLLHRSSGPADVRHACTATSRMVLLSPGASALHGAALSVADDVYAIDDLVHAGGGAPPAERVDPDAARVVLFTSGTTSGPKGVVHTANTLRAAGANFAALTDFGADERFFVVSPLASIAGVLQVLELAPLLGATAVLEAAWDDERTLDLLLDAGGTYYGGTDTALGRLLDGARRRGVPVPLRAVSVGGTMLDRRVLDAAEDEFGIRVQRVYGSSEAPNSTGGRPGEARDVRLGDEGLPAPGVELRVDAVTGELEVRGPHLFRGYLDPAGEEAQFRDDWFRTGDVAELRGGRLRIVGRLKEIAIRNGKKVSLAEVEEAFRAVADVDECAAFAVPDPTTGEHVAVAVRPRDGVELDVAAIVDAMVAAGLAKWKLPEVVTARHAALPVTATGKVRRRDLSEADGDVLWCAPRLRSSRG